MSESQAEQDLLNRHIVAYRIDGPIFFGAASRFFDQLLKAEGDIKIVILRMRRVPVIDATGLAALQSLVEHLQRRKILVFFSALQAQPKLLLERTGLLDTISRDGHHLFLTTEEAIDHALTHLKQPDHTAATRREDP